MVSYRSSEEAKNLLVEVVWGPALFRQRWGQGASKATSLTGDEGLAGVGTTGAELGSGLGICSLVGGKGGVSWGQRAVREGSDLYPESSGEPWERLEGGRRGRFCFRKLHQAAWGGVWAGNLGWGGHCCTDGA